MRLFSFAAFLPFLSLVLADNLKIARHLGDECWYSCTGSIGDLTFSDKDPEALTFYAGLAGSKMLLMSIYSCVNHWCTSDLMKNGAIKGWATYQEYAIEYGPNVDLPGYEEVKAMTEAAGVTAVPINTIDAVANAEIQNFTVYPDEYSYGMWYATLDTWNMEHYYHQTFGYSLYFLLAAMILAGLIGRFISWLTYHPMKGQNGASIRSEIVPHNSFLSRAYTKYRKYFETPALFGYRHSTPAVGFFSIPTRLQAFFIFVYVALNVIFCSVGYKAWDENQYWPGNKNTQIWRYVSDRTGIICFYNLPLLWVFAGRNDFLLWITGWSFSSVNLMHRWVARIATLQAIIHSIGYTWLERGYIAIEWEDLYWRTGVFATVFMSILLPLSILPVRKYWYEFFLITHILLAAATIPMLWYHVAIFDKEYNPFLWACIGTWVFDRVFRLVRLQVLSYNAFKGNNAVAVVTGNDNGLVRLTVNTPFKINPQPGQYYFLYNPVSLTPWENHPFTLASWEQEEKSTKLHFLIAVQSGATKRLRRKIGNGPKDMKVLLEGPYGHTEPIERYEHVLFVVGGSGVTAILPYLQKIKDNAGTRSATVIWSVRNNAYASDVIATELSNSGAEVVIHVTEEEKPAVAVLTEGEQPLANTAEKHLPQENGSTSSGSQMVIQVGRPSMEDVVRVALKRLVGSERLAVVSCGPAAMMDDMRKAIAGVYGDGEGQVSGSTIDYFEELFSW